MSDTAEIRFFDVTVTGQWSSPFGCPDVDPLTKVLVFCVVLGRKYSRYYIFFCEFDLVNGFFVLKIMFLRNGGTGKSFCVE